MDGLRGGFPVIFNVLWQRSCKNFVSCVCGNLELKMFFPLDVRICYCVIFTKFEIVRDFHRVSAL